MQNETETETLYYEWCDTMGDPNNECKYCGKTIGRKENFFVFESAWSLAAICGVCQSECEWENVKIGEWDFTPSIDWEA